MTFRGRAGLVFSWTGGPPDDGIVAGGTAHGPSPGGQVQFLNVSPAHSNPDETSVFSAPLVGGGTVSAAFRYGHTYAMGH